MKTLSAHWHPSSLEAALKKALTKPYSMSIVGEDAEAVVAAVNQGIDARLEACFVPSRGDRYDKVERSFVATEDSARWKKGDTVVHTVALSCSVSPESMLVLIRRLLEADDNGASANLASGICETLGIELV